MQIKGYYGNNIENFSWVIFCGVDLHVLQKKELLEYDEIVEILNKNDLQ